MNLSKNNTAMRRRQLISREVPHYSLRKLSVGVLSVLLGTTAYLTKAQADTNVPDSNLSSSASGSLSTGDVSVSNNQTGAQAGQQLSPTAGDQAVTQAVNAVNNTLNMEGPSANYQSDSLADPGWSQVDNSVGDDSGYTAASYTGSVSASQAYQNYNLAVQSVNNSLANLSQSLMVQPKDVSQVTPTVAQYHVKLVDVDINNKVLSDQTVTVLPTGYQSLVPKNYLYAGAGVDDSGDLTIKVRHQQQALQDTKTVTRHIHVVVDPDPKQSTTVDQKASFNRTGQKDLVTGEETWNSWSANSQVLPAWQPSSMTGVHMEGHVDALTVTPDSKDSDVTVHIVLNMPASSATSTSSENPTSSSSAVVSSTVTPTTDHEWMAPFSGFGENSISSPFGYRNLGGYKQWHDGIDIGTANYTGVIRAIHDGKVIKIGCQGHTQNDLGYYIVVESPDGYQEVYQEFAFSQADGDRVTKVKVGDSVKAGDPICELSTTTPNATHIHIGVVKPGHTFNQAMVHWSDGQNGDQYWADPLALIENSKVSDIVSSAVTPSATSSSSNRPAGSSSDASSIGPSTSSATGSDSVAPFIQYQVQVVDVDESNKQLSNKTVDALPSSYDAYIPKNYLLAGYGLNSQTLTIKVRHQTQAVSDSKTVTRHIVIDVPNGSKQTGDQKVIFGRAGVKDLVTGKTNWKNWTTPKDQFDAVQVPTVGGYQASGSIPEVDHVTPETKDSTVTVTYRKINNTSQTTSSATMSQTPSSQPAISAVITSSSSTVSSHSDQSVSSGVTPSQTSSSSTASSAVSSSVTPSHSSALPYDPAKPIDPATNPITGSHTQQEWKQLAEKYVDQLNQNNRDPKIKYGVLKQDQSANPITGASEYGPIVDIVETHQLSNGQWAYYPGHLVDLSGKTHDYHSFTDNQPPFSVVEVLTIFKPNGQKQVVSLSLTGGTTYWLTYNGN